MRIHPNKEIKMFVKKTGRFFAVTSMIVCCCCTATVFISYIKRSNIRMLCLGPFFLAAAIVLYIALKRCEKKFTKKRVRLIFAFFCLILLALQILFVRYLHYNYEMVDPKITGEFAKRFVMGEDLGSIKESYRIYAAKYPNAWGMIYLQIPFFALWKLFTGGVSIYAGQTFNVILIQLSVIMTFLTGERIFKLNSQRLFCGIISALMPVMLLYTPFFHSDTAGMIFVSCTLYFLTLAVKEKSKTKSVVYALIASLFIALGNTVKGSIAVMLISVMIFFVLKMGVKRGAILSLAAVMLFIGMSKAAYYGGLAMGISDEKMVDRYRFPVTHWIMMSLNSEYKTHVDEDVDFTMSFDTYDAKKQANIREIKARLENISTPYEACKMAYHKVARTWDSGGFSYGKYLSRSDPSGGLREVLHSRLLGSYVDGYHSAMLIAMAFGAVYAAGKRRHSALFFSIVTLTGVILFFLIWENPPRYIVTFIPVIMLLCTAGTRFITAIISRLCKRVSASK